MKTILKKFVPLLAVFLVTVGGHLAFQSFTAERVAAGQTRSIYVCQFGGFIANLCIENKSKRDSECTGKIPIGIERSLTFPWNPGDQLDFAAQVVAGNDSHYKGLTDRDNTCWVEGSSLQSTSFCRMRSESRCT